MALSTATFLAVLLACLDVLHVSCNPVKSTSHELVKEVMRGRHGSSSTLNMEAEYRLQENDSDLEERRKMRKAKVDLSAKKKIGGKARRRMYMTSNMNAPSHSTLERFQKSGYLAPFPGKPTYVSLDPQWMDNAIDLSKGRMSAAYAAAYYPNYRDKGVEEVKEKKKEKGSPST